MAEQTTGRTAAPLHGHSARPRGASAQKPAAPVPFRQFILKVHGRCNLACRYCYLYAGADSGWRDRPAAPDDRVLHRAVDRIAEHAAAHGLTELAVVLHGGEPLLTDPARSGAAVDRLRAAVAPGCTVHATVQTNGTLLTEDRLDTLARHRIRVGVSLDGGLAAHNRERVDHAGRPSWPAARRGLRLLAERYPEGYAGLLAVVDLDTDPVAAYESLLALHPPAIDFLLPHGNHSAPPPGLPAPAAAPAPYGDWLCTVFDRWWRSGRRDTRVRLFEECIALLLGLPAATESLGLQPFTAVVVETDGSIEQVDSLKSAYEGAATTGLDVFRHSFDEALAHPGVAARHAGAAALADACRMCPLLSVCGGGQYPHRYEHGSGFRNPSVYCADLQRLIRHVTAGLAQATGTPDRTGAPSLSSPQSPQSPQFPRSRPSSPSSPAALSRPSPLVPPAPPVPPPPRGQRQSPTGGTR